MAGCRGLPWDVNNTHFRRPPSQETALSLADACHNCFRAGASQHAMAEDISAGVTDQMFALNTVGPIKLARAALVHMLRRKRGRMVVIASMAAKVPTPGQAVYSGKPRGRTVTDSIAYTSPCHDCSISGRI